MCHHRSTLFLAVTACLSAFGPQELLSPWISHLILTCRSTRTEWYKPGSAWYVPALHGVSVPGVLEVFFPDSASQVCHLALGATLSCFLSCRLAGGGSPGKAAAGMAALCLGSREDLDVVLTGPSVLCMDGICFCPPLSRALCGFCVLESPSTKVFRWPSPRCTALRPSWDSSRGALCPSSKSCWLMVGQESRLAPRHSSWPQTSWAT